MNLINKILAFVFVITSITDINSATYYQNSQKGFGIFSIKDLNKDGILEIKNEQDSDLFNFINENFTPNINVEFEIRLANINNLEGKKYKYYYHNKLNKKMNPSWGIFWNFIDNKNYYSMELQCENSNLYDFTDERTIRINIYRVRDGLKELISNRNFSEHFNLYDGYNSIRLVHKNGKIDLFAGQNHMYYITSLGNSIEGKMGYITGASAKTNVSRAKLITNIEKTHELASNYCKTMMDSIDNSSEDKYEGYWDYLDMDIKSNHTRLGGKYTIAIVKNQEGYDIIYISGASVNGTIWKTYMKKGKLKKTKFLDSYNLEWYDSNMNNIFEGTNAVFKDNIILELNFPLNNAMIRFSKRNRPQNILRPIE